MGGSVEEVIRRLGRSGLDAELRAIVASPCRGADSLEDAMALAQTRELPEQVARRVVPGPCRMAIEARSAEVVWRRRLGKGECHGEVEAALLAADRLSRRVAFALFDDASRTADVIARLNRFGSRGADACQRCNRGSHTATAGELHAAIRGVGEVIDAVGRRLESAAT